MALAIGLPEDSMKKHLLPALALVLAAPCLQAQSPRFGVALNLAFPTGEFRNKTYPANADITDLQLAPRDANGHVTFGADVCILQPVDAARGNRSLLLELPDKFVADYEAGKFTAFHPYKTATGVELNSFEDGATFNFIHEGLHLGVIFAQKKLI